MISTTMCRMNKFVGVIYVRNSGQACMAYYTAIIAYVGHERLYGEQIAVKKTREVLCEALIE